jgi:hypothetical protein
MSILFGWTRARRISIEASKCTGIFSRTVGLYYVARTDTENLQDVVQFQQGYAQGQFGIIEEVP